MRPYVSEEKKNTHTQPTNHRNNDIDKMLGKKYQGIATKHKLNEIQA